jgi:HD-like signal output (HDOD) protein
MHDIGKVAYEIVAPDVLREIVQKAEASEATFADTETELGRVSHTVLGAALTQRWKLPDEVSKPVELHHTAFEQRGELTPNLQKIVDIVSFSDQIVTLKKIGHSGSFAKPKALDTGAAARIGINKQNLAGIVTALDQGIEKASAFLAMLE